MGAFKNDERLFYEVRAQDFRELEPISAAARTIYLNRTCFNGLYRLNKSGQFNTPFGRYVNPTICQPESLRAASEVLRDAQILVADYHEVLHQYAQPGDLVYLDPPYLPAGKYSDFKRYTAAQFYEEDHRELADDVNYLSDLGCHVMLTNSNHPLVYDLYAGFSIQVVSSKRNVNSKADSRDWYRSCGQHARYYDVQPSSMPSTGARPNQKLPSYPVHGVEGTNSGAHLGGSTRISFQLRLGLVLWNWGRVVYVQSCRQAGLRKRLHGHV